MRHEDYALAGVDNIMVLLERSQYIAEQIAVQQIDDFLAIPSQPLMWDKINRHDFMFLHTH